MFLICLILTYLLFQSLQNGMNPCVQTALAYLGIFILATAIICVKQKRIPVKAIPSGLACLALCLSFVLHEDQDLHLVLFLMLIPLSGIYCIQLTDANVHPFGSFYVLLDLLHCELLLPLRHLLSPFTDAVERIRQRRENRQTPRKSRKWLPVVFGFVIAIPILLIVIPLLIDADAAFESVMGGLYHHIRDALSAFGEWLERVLPFDGFILVLSLVFAPYIYAVIHTFATGKAKNENRDTAPRYRSLQKLPVSLVATVLGAVSAVYLIYLLTQSAYLFSAFSGHLPFGVSISVTEYARRGFFELCKLAGVNFLLLALSVGLTGRKNGRIAPLIKGFDIFLCLFTMLLCAISAAKILLYINTYGLTEKRLYVFAADIVLFIVFLAILLRLRFDRFPYMKVMLCALFTVTAALGLLGVGNTIAWYNTKGMLSGKLQEMTVNEIYNESGCAALPYIENLATGETTYREDAQALLTHIGTPTVLTNFDLPFQNLEYNRYQRFVKEQVEHAESFQVLVDFYDIPPVYALGYGLEYNGKDILGGGVQNADETPLEKNVTLTFDLNELPEIDDYSKLVIRFSMYLSPGDTTDNEVSVRNEEYPLFGSYVYGLYSVSIMQDQNGEFIADW